MILAPRDRRIGFATLIGDAAVTAHYRLGVGINNVRVKNGEEKGDF